MPRAAIQVTGIAKRYSLGTPEETGLRDAIAALFGRARDRRDAELWALRDVSFSIQPGEVVALVGRNGSGKTTLLKVLARITRPTSGGAEIRGRVAAILGLGAGFHPAFTGRENVYLSGAILGLERAEIAARFDEIVAFAELAPFLDTPVRRYSSGMYVRLAFSIAAHLRAQVLLIDEALAVGDLAFRRKCMAKMRQLVSEGRTILLVSHDIVAVQALAARALLLHDGVLLDDGPTDAVLRRYAELSGGETRDAYEVEHAQRDRADLSRDIELLRLELPGGGRLHTQQGLCVRARVRGRAAVQRFQLAVTIVRPNGAPVGTVLAPEILSVAAAAMAQFQLDLDDLRLAPGLYTCAVALRRRRENGEDETIDAVRDVLHFEVVPDADDEVAMRWRGPWGPIRFGEARVARIALGNDA